MKSKYIILLLTASTLFFSCEKVIKIELKDTVPQVVVEANINNDQGDNYVILSMSGSFYDSNDFELLSGATVQVTDNNGSQYLLNEIYEGFYSNPELIGTPLNRYHLSINLDQKTITANSTMPQLIPIDSLSLELQTGGGPGGGPSGDNEDFYRVYCHFTDPLGVDNFYKLKATLNYMGIQETESFIVNDDLFDGKSTKLGFREFALYPGDTLTVELFSIDRSNYDYYRLLEVNDMGSMSTSVGNPASNVDGENTIGVFGANAIASELIIIE